MNEKGYTKEDFFREFGHISLLFASLDFFITELILRLINEKATKRRPKEIDGKPLGQRLDFLARLTAQDVVRPKVLEEIQQLLPVAHNVSDKRARYIHDLWKFDLEDVARGEIERMTVKIDEKWKFKLTPLRITMDDIIKFRQEIVLVQKQVMFLLGKLEKHTQLKINYRT